MKTLNERDQVRTVVKRWSRAYPHLSPKHKSRSGLESLDVETATAEDVAKIIGNSSWVTPRECKECGKPSYDVIVFNEHDEYHRIYICPDCLKRALKLIEAK